MTTSSSSPTSQDPSARSRWVLSFLILLFVVCACARLGWWQWQRAAEFKAAERPIADQPRVSLDEITTPLVNLPEVAEGRLVRVEGEYIRTWIVPDRQSGDRVGPWVLALLERSDGSAILVVRGWGERAVPPPVGEVVVDGRLMPSQNPELSADVTAQDQLARVDPALVIATTSLDLFDGYVIASAEVPARDIERVPAPEVRKSPPGYYLQHVSYIVLWWFFGLIAIVVWLRAFLARESRRVDSPS